MARYKWIKTGYKGVRYREHPERPFRGKPDRYFVIYYKRDGKLKEEALGWASKWQGGGVLTPKKASEIREELQTAYRLGKEASTLAERRKQEKERKKQERLEQEIKERESITLKTFFEQIYYPSAQISKKPGTYKKEKQHFDRWLNPNIGHLPLQKITRENLEAIIQLMDKQDLSIRYRQYVLSTFRTIWNSALDRGYVSTVWPGKKIKLPKFENSRLRYLTQAEAEELLEALKEKRPDLHDMALLALHTGARAKEIFSLHWGDVNLEDEFVVYKSQNTKNSKDRTVPLTEEAKDMLLNRGPGAKNELIFLDAYGKPFKEIPKLFKKIVDKLGFNDGIDDPRDRVVFHSLRHTFGTWHVLNGTPINTLKELMGHSTIKVTEKYLHVLQEHKIDAMRKFERALKRTAGKVLEFPVKSQIENN